jgi:hypothetical protein
MTFSIMTYSIMTYSRMRRFQCLDHYYHDLKKSGGKINDITMRLANPSEIPCERQQIDRPNYKQLYCFNH